MMMTSEEVQSVLKHRYPMLMVDSVSSLEVGKRIRAIKNVTVAELNSMSQFQGYPMLSGTLIVEAIGQSASILFAETTRTGTRPGEFLVLGSIVEMNLLKPVIAGDRMEIDVHVSKIVGDFAVVDAVVVVDRTEVAKGRLGFARRTL
jgi:3-hydroxyacyl-[acyl-carrier-protein] dehydratase